MTTQTEQEPVAGIEVERSFTINRPAAELYSFWRDFTKLPLIMKYLNKVEILDSKRSRWIAKGPADKPVDWIAEITEDVPNERIAWKSVADSEVDNSGSVQFSRATGGRGTVVKVHLGYSPPFGRIGATVAKLFGRDPEMEVRESLRAFKAIAETGEIPTNEGTPQGDCQ